MKYRPTLKLSSAFILLSSLLLACDGDGDEKTRAQSLAQACSLNSDCADLLICSFGRCHEECTAARDCDGDSNCVQADDGKLRVCQLTEEVECEDSEDCNGDQVCASDKQCRDGCDEDAACAEGQLCVTKENVCAAEDDVNEQGELEADDSDTTSVVVAGIQVIVPNGAVKGNTTLEVERVDAPGDLPMDWEAVSDSFSVSPGDAKLRQPITINLEYDSEADDGELQVAYYNDGKARWEIVEGAVFADGIASFETDHVGVYIVVQVTEDDGDDDTDDDGAGDDDADDDADDDMVDDDGDDTDDDGAGDDDTDDDGDDDTDDDGAGDDDGDDDVVDAGPQLAPPGTLMTNARCTDNSECADGICEAVCLPASCDDGVSNGGETGVDCGGSCLAGCPNADPCEVHEDCNSHYCADGVCARLVCPGGTGVATMVGLPAGYCIDSTEVTRDQYSAWLARGPSTAGQEEQCQVNTTYSPDPACMASTYVCKDDCGDHPQTCIDWCDAKAYCEGVGKRLCGARDPEHDPETDPEWLNTEADQWYFACTGGGRNVFPYGGTYDAEACVVEQTATLPVGSLDTCQSTVPGFEGVFDLVGNVEEWVDHSHTGSFGWRGTYYSNTNNDCSYATSWTTNILHNSTVRGFRCCAP